MNNRDTFVRVTDKVGDGLKVESLLPAELLDAQGQAVDLLEEIVAARTDVGNARFEIQQEMDDEPVYVVDHAGDPDEDDHEVVTISPDWGTPEKRRSLARCITAILVRSA